MVMKVGAEKAGEDGCNRSQTCRRFFASRALLDRGRWVDKIVKMETAVPLHDFRSSRRE